MQQLGLTNYDFKPSETSLTIGNDDEEVNKLDMLINDFVLKVKSGLFDISMLSELNEIFKIIQLKSYLFSNELLDKYITYFEDMNVILGDKQTETVATEKGLSGEAILKAFKNILVRCISILKLLRSTSGKTVDDKKLIVIEYVKSDKFKVIETRIIEDISKKIKQSQEDLEKARTKKQKTLAKTIEKQLRTIERGLRTDIMETPTRFDTPPDFDIFEDYKNYTEPPEVVPAIVQPVPIRKPSPIEVGPSPVITTEAKDDEGRPFVEDEEVARQVALLQANINTLDDEIYRRSMEINRLNEQKDMVRANEETPQIAKETFIQKANVNISALQGDINAYKARINEIKARIAELQTGRVQDVVEEIADVINADGRPPDVEPVDEEEEEDDEEEEEEEEEEDTAEAAVEEPKPKSKSGEFFIYPPGITVVSEYVTVLSTGKGKDVVLPRTLERILFKKPPNLDAKREATVQKRIQKNNEEYTQQLIDNFNALYVLLDRYGEVNAKLESDLAEIDADFTGDNKFIEKIKYLFNNYLRDSKSIIVPSSKRALFYS
jgi:cell division protein FtsB